MAHVHRGIILRADSVRRKAVTLLDEHLGKITAIVGRTPAICHGTRLSYALRKGSVYYFLYDVTVLDMPLNWGGDHFLFFHHVLELCDYFMPLQAKSDQLFTLMNFLYTHASSLHSLPVQKKFLQTFYTILGLNPGRDTTKNWIAACIKEHPEVRAFKTAGFLETLERYEAAV